MKDHAILCQEAFRRCLLFFARLVATLHSVIALNAPVRLSGSTTKEPLNARLRFCLIPLEMLLGQGTVSTESPG